MLKPKKSIKKMEGYAVPMYSKHWDVKIDSNENNYGAAPAVIEALKTAGINDVSYYPYYGILTEKIAQYINCSPENIKVTNGADEAIQGIIQTYLEPDETLLTIEPSFDMPVIYTQIQGGSVIKVPFKEKWKFPVDDFLKELNNDKVKIVYIASPNNPTGSVIDEADLLKILSASKDKAVIIDETYANYGGITYHKFLEKYNNIFITRSFSKDFALAGLRLGYIISAKENIQNLKKVISPFSVNALAAKAGIAALNNTDYFEKIKTEINQTKEEMKNFFEGFGFTVYPSAANFLLIDCSNKAEFIHNKLKCAGIAVKMYKTPHPLPLSLVIAFAQACHSFACGCRHFGFRQPDFVRTQFRSRKGRGELYPLARHLRITIPNKQGFEKLKNALKIKPALVFDMDGVLINAKSYRETIRKTFEHYTGKTVSHEEIQAVKNKGGMNNDWDLTNYLLEREGVKVSYEDLVKTFQKIYWDEGKGLINIETPLFERSLFEKLSKNYNISIFTGRYNLEAMFAINKFNITDLFFPVITSDDIPAGREKPYPDGLILTKELTIASKYYYFGDTQDDIKCAKAAGYTAIGVLPPQDKSENLRRIMKAAGADEVINSVNEIPELLEKLK